MRARISRKTSAVQWPTLFPEISQIAHSSFRWCWASDLLFGTPGDFTPLINLRTVPFVFIVGIFMDVPPQWAEQRKRFYVPWGYSGIRGRSRRSIVVRQRRYSFVDFFVVKLIRHTGCSVNSVTYVSKDQVTLEQFCFLKKLRASFLFYFFFN